MMKSVLFAVLAAAGILAAGCAQDQGNEVELIPGSLRITIVNEAGNSSRAIGSPSQVLENTVHNFAVFVFDYSSGELEKSQVFTNLTADMTGVVTDLSTATTKRIVVMANYDFTLLDQVGTYEQLNAMALDIDSQLPGDFAEYGLFMSGEYEQELTLNPTNGNSIEVPIRRVVSKIELGRLIVIPDNGYDLNLLTLDSVGIQKVPSRAYMTGEVIYPIDVTQPDEDYRGGLMGGAVSTVWHDLSEAVSLPADYISGEGLTPNIYFYVFPNDNSQGNATILSLAATYNGTRLYYNFIINDRVVANQTDGTYITRNKIYTLYVTLRSLGVGDGNPDSTDRYVDLEVEVVVVDWEGWFTQVVEW